MASHELSRKRRAAEEMEKMVAMEAKLRESQKVDEVQIAEEGTPPEQHLSSASAVLSGVTPAPAPISLQAPAPLQTPAPEPAQSISQELALLSSQVDTPSRDPALRALAPSVTLEPTSSAAMMSPSLADGTPGGMQSKLAALDETEGLTAYEQVCICSGAKPTLVSV